MHPKDGIPHLVAGLNSWVGHWLLCFLRKNEVFTFWKNKPYTAYVGKCKKYLEVGKFTWCTIYIEILWNHAPQRWHTAPGGWAQQLGGPLASLLPAQKWGFYILQHSHILHMLVCTRNLKKYLEVVKFTWCTIYIEILWNHAPQRWHTAPGGWAQQLGGPLASLLPAQKMKLLHSATKAMGHILHMLVCTRNIKKYLGVGKCTWCTIYIEILWNHAPQRWHTAPGGWAQQLGGPLASLLPAQKWSFYILKTQAMGHILHMLVCTRNIKKYLEVVKFTWCTIYIYIYIYIYILRSCGTMRPYRTWGLGSAMGRAFGFLGSCMSTGIEWTLYKMSWKGPILRNYNDIYTYMSELRALWWHTTL